jgi:hypothetical protein
LGLPCLCLPCLQSVLFLIPLFDLFFYRRSLVLVHFGPRHSDLAKGKSRGEGQRRRREEKERGEKERGRRGEGEERRRRERKERDIP